MMASQTTFSTLKLIKLLSNHLLKLILIDANSLSTFLFCIKIITFSHKGNKMATEFK